ncbi:Protein PAMN-1 [Aphelenchoides avenae]|nr:Protein PAMN-1 [Aphelenchus avenae]
MLLYGCSQPAYSGQFWKGGATCGGGTHILWAWARNAPALSLPDDVAFPVGHEGDPIQYLVLQIHYAKPFVGNVQDYSGVTVFLSDQRPKYVATVYLFVSGEPIPPRTEAFITNVSCTYDGEVDLHPFAFRTHTHQMGRVVSAYVKHDEKWTQIGKRNPQWPQLFQPSPPSVVIRKGDFMAAMCRFDSHDKDETVPMGSMGSNEMCNFYMMFYRDADAVDPFPNGAMCGYNENPEVVVNEYPKEGTTLLPKHPEWEHAAHQSGKAFGVVEKMQLKTIGGVNLGQISGMAFDKNGNVVVFHRATRVWDGTTFAMDNTLADKSPIDAPTVLVAEDTPSGLKLVGKYGKSKFYLPHGILVDASNYYYTTDVGSHQVIKWKVEGDDLVPVWQLGEKFVPGNDREHFCKPAAIAVAQWDGSIYIADGYCNSRVMHFAKDGRYIGEWGQPSQASRKPQRSRSRQIYVADRENGRVQTFAEHGEPLHEIRHPKEFQNVYSAHFCPQRGLFFIPGMSFDLQRHPILAYAVPLNSTEIQYSFAPKSASFQRPHILRARDNNIWVGEISETGGVLWRLEIQAELKHHAMPSGGQAEGEVLAVSSPYGKSDVSAVLFASVAVLLVGAAAYFTVRLYKRKTATPQTVLDRKGFKPLRTMDFSSDEEDLDNVLNGP